MVSLYIKCQPKNNVQYFGKTINDPYLYSGSGVVWKDMHKKHNIKDVVTMVVGQFDENDPMLVEYALGFSAANGIVDSKAWANLVPEDGLDGGPRKYGNQHAKGYKHTQEALDKIAEASRNHVWSQERKDSISKAKMGHSVSKETRDKLSKSLTGQKRVTIAGKRTWALAGDLEEALNNGATLGW